jgi:butyryl-CoA:acetate CoA-transferase
MNDFLKMYKDKLKTADEAVRAVKSGDWLDYTMAHGMPVALDAALAKRKDELRDIKVRSCLTIRPRKIIEADPDQEVFTYCNWHFGGYDRGLHDKGQIYYIPLLYRNKPYFYRNVLDVDVAMISVTPMDRHGYFNFSLNNSASAAILEKAKIVMVEVNEKLPRVFGIKDECIHISDVDFVVEGDNPDLPTLSQQKATETDIKIAEHIVGDIGNGSVLQLGIGGLPNTIGHLLAKSDVKDLGVHSEMLVDAYLELHKEGKLTNRKKNIDRNRGVFSFCMGSSELFEWARENPGLFSAPVDYTNGTDVVAQFDNLVAINNCIEIDLFGQTCSETSGFRQITGTGGQLDFMTGSHLSGNGKGYICMTSTYTDKSTGMLRSRIVPTLPLGSIVTVPRTQPFYVVTEYGKVNLTGNSSWEIAEKLIGIAHPDFREALIKEAETMKIWRKSNR